MKTRSHVLLFLFQHITTDTYIPCLVDLCKALWEVMKSYHKIIEWHETKDAPISPTLQETGKYAIYVKFFMPKI